MFTKVLSNPINLRSLKAVVIIMVFTYGKIAMRYNLQRHLEVICGSTNSISKTIADKRKKSNKMLCSIFDFLGINVLHLKIVIL